MNQISWDELYDLRIVLAHIYDRVDQELNWKHMTVSIPILKNLLEDEYKDI